MHAYLSTIGSSGTDELRQSLVASDHAKAIELIGQFGIGLLSAFIVANKVELTTKSRSSEGLKWVSLGSKEYSLEPCDVKSIGTTVTLYLSPQNLRYLEPEHLRTIVRTYADIIGIPIFINDEISAANEVNAPWHREYSSPREENEAVYAYWENRFRNEHSLDVWRVKDQFTFFDAGSSTPRLGFLNGVLGITDRHIPGLETRGVVDIYVARMFIVSGSRDLLPDWARFIQGVIECGELSPNAARDNIMRNDALHAARQVLGRSIIDRLTHLFNNDSKRFTEIMRWHSYQILAMCTMEANLDFFKQVADMVPLPSDLGFITVPKYLERSAQRSGSNEVLYISEASSVSQYYMLCESQGFHVFDATDIFAEEFLQRYAELWPDKISLNRLDVPSSEQIFSPASEQEIDSFSRLDVAFRRFPVIPRLSRFQPKEIPALLTGSHNAEGRREMESIASNVTLPASLRDKVKKYLQESTESLSLQLNVSNPTILRLAQRSSLTDDLSTTAITSIYKL